MKQYHILTLGCQMNISDSEKIEAILSDFGIKKTNEKSADLIIVNCCSVRQKPIDRIWGKLKVWTRINPKAKKILTGCVLEKDLKKMSQKFDFYFNIENITSFVQWLENNFAPLNYDKLIKINYLEIETKSTNKEIALIPIMNGCDNFCSYCAVPYTRGREWSRKPDNILKEIKCKVKQGYKEIILLGQNVCSYRNPKSQIPNPKQFQNSKFKFKNNDFVELLEKIVEIQGDFSVKFMSPHPKDFSDELIDLIAKEKKISREIHLPMQSGDDKILKLMNRGYSSTDYLKLVEKMNKKIKGLIISTDIIVGFPGELKKNFMNTVKIVNYIKFNKAYVSIYSPRPGTVAHKKYIDIIPQEVKRKRWLALDKIINKKDS